MSYTLDDAHEAIAVAEWYANRNPDPPGTGPTYGFMSWDALEEALDAIEAELPDPCPECGSDQCEKVSFMVDDFEIGRRCKTPRPAYLDMGW